MGRGKILVPLQNFAPQGRKNLLGPSPKGRLLGLSLLFLQA